MGNDPLNFTIRHQLIQIRKAYEHGLKEEARKSAKDLSQAHPELEEVWLVLASLSSPADALAYLENALRVNPNSKAARKGIRLATRQLTEKPTAEETEMEDTQPIQTSKREPPDEIVNLPEVSKQKTTRVIESNSPYQKANKETPPKTDQPIYTGSQAPLSNRITAVQEKPREKAKEENKEVLKQSESSSKKELLAKGKQPERTEQTQTSRKKQFSKIVQKPATKTRVEVIELLAIGGTAILLPLIVFLYFYLTNK